MRGNHFPRSTVVVVALSLTWAASTARADDNLRAEMAAVATQLGSFLKGERVQINGFEFKTEDAKVSAAAGPGIAQILAEELRKHDVIVAKNAPLQIQGYYTDGIDKQSKILTAAVFGEVVDENGKLIMGFKRSIFGDAALASLFGVTGDLEPREDVRERSDALMDALDDPKIHVEGARVSTARGAPYSVELLIRSGDGWAAKQPRVVDGQATLAIAPNEEFAIRLINRSGHEAAVFLSIDGLGLFAFSENRSLSQVIVPAKSSAVVSGWHRRGDTWEAFRRHALHPNALPAMLHPGRNRQVVTAVFSACWNKDEPLPSDEPLSVQVRRFSRCGGPAGTELGLPAEADTGSEPAIAEIPDLASPDRTGTENGLPAIAELPEVLSVPPDWAVAEIPDADLALTSARTKPHSGYAPSIRELRREFGVVRTAISVRIE